MLLPCRSFSGWRMPRLLGFSALVMLAACQLGGPSRQEIESALQSYWETPFPLEIMDPERLREAQIVSIEECEVIGASFVCPVHFIRSDGSALRADVWVARDYRTGWSASGIVPREVE